MTGLEAISEFENEADTQIKNLVLWRQPLRSLLSSLYLSADNLISGPRFRRQKKSNTLKGSTLLARISYLTRFFPSLSLQIGANIDDAMSIFDERLLGELRSAVVYSHFCTLMPAAHRGYFEVEAIENGFRLQHPSNEFRNAEEKDIIFTELSLAFDKFPPPTNLPSFDSLIRDWPKLNGSDLGNVLFSTYAHYTRALSEPSLLTESAYKKGLGFTRDDFQRVRAALITLSEFCLGMASAAERRRLTGSHLKRHHWERECREWAAPLLRRNFVLGIIQALAKVPSSTIDDVVAPFLMDANNGDFQNSGDGYFAPLVAIGDSLLLSPHALRAHLPERNLLYVVT